MVGRTSRRSGTCRETLPEVRKWSEALPEVWNCSGDPPRVPELVVRPSRRAKTCQETLSEVKKWSGHPPRDPKVVGRPSEMVRKWLGD